MRIVGGELRGRKLVEPKTNNIRPTTDRTRESLFNILNHAWPEKLNDTRVVDIFAGTGALGLEALSRGAKFALFIEESAEGRGLLRQNIEALGQTGATKVFRRDATKPGSVGNIAPFDLVFADPPYGKGYGEKAAAAFLQGGWIKADTLLLLEERSDCLPEALAGYKMCDKREFGETSIGFFVPEP